MVVLPKIGQPVQAKHLRPISLGSAVCKVFSRVLLNRSLPYIGEAGSRQCSGQGRQANDYLFTVTRVMSLEREWRFGLGFVKLDLSKAFDRVSRDKLYSMIRARVGCNALSRCWWALLQETTAKLQTNWGQTSFGVKVGIKQGAVESPTLFSVLAELCYADTAQRFLLA